MVGGFGRGDGTGRGVLELVKVYRDRLGEVVGLLSPVFGWSPTIGNDRLKKRSEEHIYGEAPGERRSANLPAHIGTRLLGMPLLSAHSVGMTRVVHRACVDGVEAPGPLVEWCQRRQDRRSVAQLLKVFLAEHSGTSRARSTRSEV